MGMYDELNKINNSIKNQNDYTRKNAEYKSYLKDLQLQFKDALHLELTQALQNNVVIYDLDFKNYIVNQVVEDYKALKNNDAFLKYESDIRIYLAQSYYTIANQVRMYQKRQDEVTQTTDDYRRQIALERWNIQRQREQIKLQKEAEQLRQLQQKQNINVQVQPKSNNGLQAFKIIMMVLFAPIAIIGLILWGVLSAAAKSK